MTDSKSFPAVTAWFKVALIISHRVLFNSFVGEGDDSQNTHKIYPHIAPAAAPPIATQMSLKSDILGGVAGCR